VSAADPGFLRPSPEPPVPAAVAALAPGRFGFEDEDGGWIRTTGSARLAFASLDWRHASPRSAAESTLVADPDPLHLLVELQAETWGMPPEEVVPANILAVLADTGGSVLVAFDPALGFGRDGWRGFAIALGGRDGTLVSHMLGVHPAHRGAAGVGWALKLLQGHEALRAGHRTAVWTFDPMRGVNARLNLHQPGAPVDHCTPDKYGALRTTLYGEVPSDRFTARWELRSPVVAARLAAVHAGSHRPPDAAAVAAIPEVTTATLEERIADAPPRLRYRIPGDIDQLGRDDPVAAVRWRREMRHVLSRLLPTSWATAPPSTRHPADPPRLRHRAAPRPVSCRRLRQRRRRRRPRQSLPPPAPRRGTQRR